MKPPPGLSSSEALRLLQANGPNEISASHLESRFYELKKILLDPMGLMLLTLAGLYGVLGDKVDAIVLLLAYIPVTAVDVVLDLRTRKALSALKATFKLSAKVFRDGTIHEIAKHEIVIGDVIIFEEGQSLPADGTILEAQNISINESALTGESIPVEKSAGQPFFGGTTILQGSGLGKIEQTGIKTRFGKIAELLQDTQSETSPLQRKVNHVVKRVVLIALGLALVLFFVEYTKKGQILQSLIAALTFGMAAIPEEFPLVFTLYLSMGAWRLSRHGVLVKSLPSVETLGSVTVICTDKTGTLTEGHFQLEEIKATDSSVSIDQLWRFTLMACEVAPVDSMETAIYEKGADFVKELKGWNLKWDYPFELLGKHMSHVWENTSSSSQIIAMKGSVEGVLEHCEIESSIQKDLLEQVNTLASQGKRLLGLACREGLCTGDRATDERKLKFIGLLVFSDPVRASAKPAIAACQAAHIKIKMLTGDHPLTAHAVADQTGIIHSHQFLFTGSQLAQMSQKQRWEAYEKGAVFSRVLPEQKYEMVQALKSTGNVVAMTGDGINDAPALKLADIGISMGLNATDVARSSSQMILLKNDFTGIVEAVFEGRRIFSNLKRSFSYLISFHVPVILLALFPPMLGWGDLLLPIHIILLELVVHPVSAFAFENLPANKVTTDKGLMSRSRLFKSLLSGTLLSIGSLGLFLEYTRTSGPVVARTLALTAVLLGNMFFVFVESWPFQTRRLLVTAISLLALTATLVWSSKASALLHLAPLEFRDFLIAFAIGAAASLPTFLMDIREKKLAELRS